MAEKQESSAERIEIGEIQIKRKHVVRLPPGFGAQHARTHARMYANSLTHVGTACFTS